MDDITKDLQFGTLIASSIASLKASTMEVVDPEQGVNPTVDQEMELALDEEPGKRHDSNIGVGKKLNLPKHTQGVDDLSIERNGEAVIVSETLGCQGAVSKVKVEDVKQIITNTRDSDSEEFVLHGIKVEDCLSLNADARNVASATVEVKQDGNGLKKKRAIGSKETHIGPGSKYFCTICTVSCTSEVNFLSHKAGSKHKKFVEWNKRHQDAHAAASTGTSKPFFEEQLNALGKVEPLVGLDYVTEHQNLNSRRDPIYSCGLCDLAGITMASCLSHITGFRHRIHYLQLHHPERVNDAKNHKKSGPSPEMVSIIAEIEKLDGRGRIEVISTDEGDDLIAASQARKAMKRTATVDFEGEDVQKEKVAKVTGNLTCQENTRAETFNRGESSKPMNQRKGRRNQQGPSGPFNLFDDNFMNSGLANIVILNHLVNFKISCDEEASLALKASRALTKALFDYRLEVPSKGRNYNDSYEMPGFAGVGSSSYHFGNPQGCPQARDANEMVGERGHNSPMITNKRRLPKKKTSYNRQRRAKRRVSNHGQETELLKPPSFALPPSTATASFGQSYLPPYTDY
uniref:C2H2-type domain-containing protein n=1 Tax=Eptatretus burgeri TaxID=7764 RepID=A0A8C4R6C3_EPTBU